MIKFGIYTIEQLERQNYEMFWGGQRFIAADLYDELQNHPHADKLQKAVLLTLKDASGAYKRVFWIWEFQMKEQPQIYI